MAYDGQNLSHIEPNEFSDTDRRMAYEMVRNAAEGRPVSAAVILRLSHLEKHGSTVQAPYFLKQLGLCEHVDIDIDLPVGESGLPNKHDFDNVYGTIWRLQGNELADNK